MDKEQLGALYKEERAFLHDLATPVSAVTFLIDSLLETTRGRPGHDPEDVNQLDLVRQAVEKMGTLLKTRRALLIERGEKL